MAMAIVVCVVYKRFGADNDLTFMLMVNSQFIYTIGHRHCRIKAMSH